mmetsp:Transcript_62695/g.166393  ORF Transcript_62695/g.166393 Transcript_62695/m.166393 type:complete len:348 (+) Transcript_62695:220-1263(+)
MECCALRGTRRGLVMVAVSRRHRALFPPWAKASTSRLHRPHSTCWEHKDDQKSLLTSARAARVFPLGPQHRPQLALSRQAACRRRNPLGTVRRHASQNQHSLTFSEAAGWKVPPIHQAPQLAAPRDPRVKRTAAPEPPHHRRASANPSAVPTNTSSAAQASPREGMASCSPIPIRCLIRPTYRWRSNCLRCRGVRSHRVRPRTARHPLTHTANPPKPESQGSGSLSSSPCSPTASDVTIAGDVATHEKLRSAARRPSGRARRAWEPVQSPCLEDWAAPHLSRTVVAVTFGFCLSAYLLVSDCTDAAGGRLLQLQESRWRCWNKTEAEAGFCSEPLQPRHWHQGLRAF